MGKSLGQEKHLEHLRILVINVMSQMINDYEHG